MAIIKNNSIGKIVVLNTQHIFGRNQYNSNTYIPDNDISNSHATIFWKDGHWFIQDHSKLGTLVNGKYITHTTYKLSNGDSIQYGRNETTKWVFIDNDIPNGYLISVINKNEIITLPNYTNQNDNTHEIIFYCTKNKKWKFEKNGDLIDLTPREIIEFNNKKWIFVQNDNVNEILDYGSIINQAYFLFILSDNEENVQVKIISDKLNLDLGDHQYSKLLLTLARKRLADAELEYVYNDQGWTNNNDLANELTKNGSEEIDYSFLNLQILKLRKQLIQLEPYGYLFSNIIERKNTEIRFAHPYFKIQKENQCIGEIYTIKTRTDTEQ